MREDHYHTFCRTPELIENYEIMKHDKLNRWHCHHRKETDENMSVAELKAADLYYDRPPEELIFLTAEQHMRIHMSARNIKGTKKAGSHKRRISEGMRKHYSTNKGALIHVHRDDVSAVDRYFKSCQEAAEFIGCTRQLVSQVARGNTNNRQACGFEVEYIIED